VKKFQLHIVSRILHLPLASTPSKASGSKQSDRSVGKHRQAGIPSSLFSCESSALLLLLLLLLRARVGASRERDRQTGREVGVAVGGRRVV
jgi:hypothetical protein